MQNKLLFSFFCALIVTFLVIPVTYSQTPTYSCTLANDAYTASNEYEFDVYLLRTGTTVLQLGGLQIGLSYDTLALNGGTITTSWVAGTVDTSVQLHNPAPYSPGTIKVASFLPRGKGNGKIISNVAPGLRIGRLRLTNTIPFTSRPLSVNWIFNIYPSKISSYSATANSDITNQISFLNTLANTGNTKRVLTLTAFIEGYTNAGGTAMLVAPTAVTVELHTATSPYTLVESQTAPLTTAGVGTFNFTTAVNGTNYYVVVKTLNTIETWSANQQSFTGDALSYDFTNTGTQAYGSNMVQKGTKWCIYSGDVNQDGIVDGTDLGAIDNDNTNISSNPITDLNKDGIVDGTDLAIADNNNTNIIGRIAPAGAPATKLIKQRVKLQGINTK
jgi:hypothetical protein